MNILTKVKKHAEADPTINIVKAEIQAMWAQFLHFRDSFFRMQETIIIETIRQRTLIEYTTNVFMKRGRTSELTQSISLERLTCISWAPLMYYEAKMLERWDSSLKSDFNRG